MSNHDWTWVNFVIVSAVLGYLALGAVYFH
jgi:hypothetical protein